MSPKIEVVGLFWINHNLYQNIIMYKEVVKGSSRPPHVRGVLPLCLIFLAGWGRVPPLGRPAQGALLLPTNVNPPKGVPPPEGPARKPSGGKGPLWAGLLR